MSQYVATSAPASLVSAYIIFNKKMVQVAKIQAVTQKGSSNTHLNLFNFGSGPSNFVSVKGCGSTWDRFSDLLKGQTIDGHLLYDDVIETKQSKSLLKRFSKDYNGKTEAERELLTASYFAAWDKKAERIGAVFCNGRTGLHMYAGLKLLEAKGYTIIQAI